MPMRFTQTKRFFLAPFCGGIAGFALIMMGIGHEASSPAGGLVAYALMALPFVTVIDARSWYCAVRAAPAGGPEKDLRTALAVGASGPVAFIALIAAWGIPDLYR